MASRSFKGGRKGRGEDRDKQLHDKGGGGDQGDGSGKEPYNPTGNLEVDFGQMCLRAEINTKIEVVIRGKAQPPQSQDQSNEPPGKESKGSKKDSDSKGHGRDHGKEDKHKSSYDEEGFTRHRSKASLHIINPNQGQVQNQEPPAEPTEPQPTTYSVKEKFDYFKPKIEVEYDNEDNKMTAREVYIRGWRLELPIITILSSALPKCSHLTTINLWNVGLKDETLAGVASLTLLCKNLKHVHLDGNNVPGQRFSAFITPENCNIHTLSLRSCGITSTGATMLGHALFKNKSLVTLDLCNNKIGSEGAKALAMSLRLNRTLHCLMLANNEIDDSGGLKLAEVLNRFPLTHEEIVQRRLLLSKKSVSTDDGTHLSLSPHNRKHDGGSRDNRPQTSRQSIHMSPNETKIRDKPKPKKKESKSKDDKNKKDDSRSKKSSGGDSSSRPKNKKAASNRSSEKKVVQQEHEPEQIELTNPLMEPIVEENGEIYLRGNRTLIHLNLSRNKLGEESIKAFWAAVQHQCNLIPPTDGHVIVNNKSAPGLLRLALQRNKVDPSSSEIMKLLVAKMLTRDPNYVPPPEEVKMKSQEDS
ncbi:Leucine-rich repeat-containing protein 71 [Trichoplax sp. H2]|uniref:Leucine-rich repeat-containing protein 71 n=1 Tax=Trichoplax adhaerens TaxID=10228 RepID=B3RM75_TRIAD|nr:hypothetical protein TRIADDRAFT_52261 [Trichoplax adhaerens]EDV29648.1 hypothetical protein TRIADDRAFT_52261 [Trichoplax adhaerens]RDD46696.1 Leucine-rich repeat-containing protein 71 [Trichoplax sp. H2]|eukprot:XP_002108850.1 hypothetical protein TRIADDRAFT_52261 [Trichoplax adhaerens]